MLAGRRRPGEEKKSILRGIYPSNRPSGHILFRAAARQRCAPWGTNSARVSSTSCGWAQGMLDAVVNNNQNTWAARAGAPAIRSINTIRLATLPLGLDPLPVCNPKLANLPRDCLDTGSPASSPLPRTSASFQHYDLPFTNAGPQRACKQRPFKLQISFFESKSTGRHPSCSRAHALPCSSTRPAPPQPPTHPPRQRSGTTRP